MEKENVTGKADELKGKLKQGAGHVTNDAELHDEGVIDEVKGKAKQAFGDLKGALKQGDREAGSEINRK